MIVARFQCVTLLVIHPLTSLEDLSVTHEHSSQTDPRKPHHHCRFSRRRHLCSAAWQWQGLCRIRVRFPPLPWLSARPQGDLSRRRVSHTPLPLCPCPAGWAHHLAYPVHHVQSRLHGPPAFRPSLSLHAPRGGPRCPVGDAWRAEFGTVCGDWAYLAHGPLPPRLCVWPPESGHRADPVWAAPARLFP